MIGIIIFMNPLRMSGSPIGYILTILSAATFALYGIISLKRSVRYGGIALTCFSFLFGSMEMFLLILISRMASVSAILTREGLTTFANIPILQGINGHTCLNLIYIGIFVTGLGYTFYFLAMETISAATASLVFYIKPALAPVLAFIIIHEPIMLNMMFGILFLLIGSLISFIPDFKAQKRE
ncbi:DMT family transporter [Terrilactibacillus sp. S3-3]|nr:DMT family transporter [Terrilactibacillus sp. S3-3]